MRKRYPAIWPSIWLISDARNDAVREQVILRLPRGAGLIFRHYHLPEGDRHIRFKALARLARQRGMCVALAGTARQARRWGADLAYGSPKSVTQGPALPRLVTAHSLREMAAARRARASALVMSPVFPTRSHPGAPTLGPLRFRLLAARAGLPVIALGGMNRHRARALACAQWAAIDGLSTTATRQISKDS